jgi:hypothetical protein
VDEQDVSSLTQGYLSIHGWFQKVLKLEEACFVGLWLGILSSDNLYATVAEYYRKSGRSLKGHHDYHGKEYNRGGFFGWEKDAIAGYFRDRKRLLVLAAGGGREVLALLRLGYQVEGFETNPNLVLAANELLREERFDPAVRLIARDEGPNTETAYDGIVVGWGMYMHIQTRKLRIALLRQLRTQIRATCPLLLSFSPRYSTPRQYYASAKVANAIRHALRREPAAEVGDWLIPHYIHHFTQDEVVSELAEGGFDCVHYSTEDFAHAVGVAV